MTNEIEIIAVEENLNESTILIFTYKGYYSLLNRTLNINTGGYQYSCGLEEDYPLLLEYIDSILSHMPYCRFKKVTNKDLNMYKDCIEYINRCVEDNKQYLNEIINEKGENHYE